MAEPGAAGSASANAVAEAAGAASEIGSALSAMSGDGPPSPSPETPTPSEPPSTPEPEGFTPDYDPEEADAALTAAAEKSSAPPVDKEARIKALEAELLTLRGPAATVPPAPVAPTPAAEPAPVEPPAPEVSIDEVLKSLVDGNQEVNRYFAQVQQYGQDALAYEKHYGELTTAINETTQGVLKAQAVVGYIQELAKANPEDFRLRERLQEEVAKLHDLRAKHQDLQWQRAECQRSYQDALTAYRQGRESLYNHAAQVKGSRAEAARLEKVRETAKANTIKEWNTAFPRVMDALKIPASKREAARQILLEKAAAHHAMGLPDIENLEGWMFAKGREIATFIQAVAADATQTYAKDKKADTALHQPGPKGPAAVVKPGQQKPTSPRMSSKDADREAHRAMVSAFGR